MRRQRGRCWRRSRAGILPPALLHKCSPSPGCCSPAGSPRVHLAGDLRRGGRRCRSPVQAAWHASASATSRRMISCAPLAGAARALTSRSARRKRYISESACRNAVPMRPAAPVSRMGPRVVTVDNWLFSGIRRDLLSPCRGRRISPIFCERSRFQIASLRPDTPCAPCRSRATRGRCRRARSCRSG